MIKEINNYKGYFVTDDGKIFSNKKGTLNQMATYYGKTSGYEQVDFFLMVENIKN